MELFNKSGAVKLRSHFNKYLVADDDQVTIRQSRNGSTRKARWLVELVESNSSVIRLKSCHGRYFTASKRAFLLGMTGNKVLQMEPENMKDLSIQWQPIQDGFQVKLQAFGGTYLRANGGPPPWRNSITHDSPYTGSTHNWILWDVEAVEIMENESLISSLSMVSSFSSLSDELSGVDIGSPVSIQSSYSPKLSIKKYPAAAITQTGMDLFNNAKAVRLRSHHGKYLHAEEDEESVSQSRSGSSKYARWTVEFVDNIPDNNIIRLKSCNGKYLTASNQPFLLGMAGRKVLQTLPRRLDSSLEWEPIRQGNQVKLKTRYGQFLRANGRLPPWSNSVTHDIPHRTSTQEWILWDVDVVDIVLRSPAAKPPPPPPPQLVPHSDSLSSTDSNSPSAMSAAFSRQQSADSLVSSPPKQGDGRIINYHIADEFGDVHADEALSIRFKGSGVDELTRRLEEETGLEGIILCSRNPLNGKLYQLKLQLPPNNMPINVVVVVVQSSPIGEL